MRFSTFVQRDGFGRFSKFVMTILGLILCVVYIFTMPMVSANDDVSDQQIDGSAEFDSNIWLITDLYHEDVNVYILEEPVVLDRDQLQSRLKIIIESDIIETWNLRIYDPETLQTLFRVKGTAEDLGKPIDWNMNGEPAEQYYCMLSVFYKDQNVRESKPLIFYINRSGKLNENLETAMVEESIEDEWVIEPLPTVGEEEDFHVFIEQDQESIIFDSTSMARFRVTLTSDHKELIKDWSMRICDAETLEMIASVNGSTDDLGKPQEWYVQGEVVDEYYCLLTIRYLDEVKSHTFYIEPEDLVDDDLDGTETALSLSGTSMKTLGSTENSVVDDLMTLEQNFWMFRDVFENELSVYVFEEPAVIDRHELHSKLSFFVKSDLIDKWKLRIYDPKTLRTLFITDGNSIDLRNAIEWDMNGNPGDEYYCMLTVFYKDSQKESRPFIFFINRNQQLSKQANYEETQSKIIQWVIKESQGIGFYLYTVQESTPLSGDNWRYRFKLDLSNNDFGEITGWRLRLFDALTLEPVASFDGSPDDLHRPIEWEPTGEVADEYYCMLAVSYSNYEADESQTHTFYLNRQLEQDSTRNPIEVDNSDFETNTSDTEEIASENPIEVDEYAVTTDHKDYGFKNDQFFIVGFADLTLGLTEVQGNIEPISSVDDFQNGLYVDGRFALYLKGKIQGKYLLAAQIDTTEKSVNTLLNNLNRKDRSFILDQVDPDTYYPVYGDESVRINEVDSEGKLYLKIAWEDSVVVWGNYQISLNETRISSFQRTLYGGRIHLETPKSDDSKTATTKGDIFWAEALHLHSSDELKATGGSLYYLKHTDLVVGSEKLSIEVRDLVSGQVIKSYPLNFGSDYQLDYVNGRIVLSNSLIKAYEVQRIINDTEMYLIAEYDFTPQNDVSSSTYGFSGTHYLTDKLRLAGRYLKERTANGKSYQLYGIDGRYNLTDDISLNLEWASSGRFLSGRFYSEDGGLTYIEIPELNGQNNSNAVTLGLNAKVLKQVSWLEDPMLTIQAEWYEKGFSTAKHQTLHDTKQLELGFNTKLGAQYSFSSRYLYKDELGKATTSSADVQVTGNYNNTLSVTGEAKYQKVSEGVKESEEIVGALGMDYQLNDQITVYTHPRFTYDNKAGKVAETAVIAGTNLEITEEMKVILEGMTGSSGHSVRVSGDYNLTPNNHLYGNLQYELDQLGQNQTTILLGDKGNITDTLKMYAEYQLMNGSLENSNSGIIGLEYDPEDNWSFFLDYTKKQIDKLLENRLLSRELLSGGVIYLSDSLEYNTRILLKHERGAEILTEILLANSAKLNLHDGITLICNLDYLKDTKQSVKGDIGLAYRPVENDQLNLLGKYVFHASTSPKKMGTLDEVYHVISAEGTYDLTDQWQIGNKLAYKYLTSLVAADKWTESETYLWVNRVNYHLTNRWDMSGEYRILHNSLANDTRSGVLFAVYRYLNQNMKLGVGYNFTDFSDDLTDLSYQARGPFINWIVLW